MITFDRSTPSVCFGNCSTTTTLLRRHKHWLASAVVIDAIFDLVAEMADQALNWPGRRIAERANGVAFNLARNIQKIIDL